MIYKDDEQICVCYDVPAKEIRVAITEGCQTVEAVSDATYACQGCGGLSA